MTTGQRRESTIGTGRRIRKTERDSRTSLEASTQQRTAHRQEIKIAATISNWANRVGWWNGENPMMTNTEGGSRNPAAAGAQIGTRGTLTRIAPAFPLMPDQAILTDNCAPLKGNPWTPLSSGTTSDPPKACY